tara:strand:- start:32 stop:388 length:357 start_codon:yes stop_codon:yes gene_type:complete
MAKNNSNFDDLKKEFPIFKIKNKTDLQQIIRLADNDSVQLPPRTTIRVESSKLIQVPDMKLFRPVEPSMEDYQAAGIVPTGEKEKKTAPKSSSTSSNSGSTSGSSSSEGSESNSTGKK